MDPMTYAAIVEICARLAGRLSDDVISVARSHYAAGEWAIGDQAMVLSLGYYGVGITGEERRLIRSFIEESEVPDLAEVPGIAEVPPVAYLFRSTHPADAPDPSRVDSLLAAKATRHGAQRVYRAWRDPLEGAPDGPAWVYVVQVAEGTDELKAYSGLTAVPRTDQMEKWALEVFVEGAALTPYQAAALAAAQLIWTA